MQQLTIAIEPHAAIANTFVVTFAGDFDGSIKENLQEVQDFVDKAKEGTQVILDFSGLTYMNSYAIGHLMTWHNRLQAQGGRILVVGANTNVEEIFQILGIGSLFKNYPSIAAAESDLK